MCCRPILHDPWLIGIYFRPCRACSDCAAEYGTCSTNCPIPGHLGGCALYPRKRAYAWSNNPSASNGCYSLYVEPHPGVIVEPENLKRITSGIIARMDLSILCQGQKGTDVRCVCIRAALLAHPKNWQLVLSADQNQLRTLPEIKLTTCIQCGNDITAGYAHRRHAIARLLDSRKCNVSNHCDISYSCVGYMQSYNQIHARNCQDDQFFHTCFFVLLFANYPPAASLIVFRIQSTSEAAEPALIVPRITILAPARVPSPETSIEDVRTRSSGPIFAFVILPRRSVAIPERLKLVPL